MNYLSVFYLISLFVKENNQSDTLEDENYLKYTINIDSENYLICKALSANLD